MNYWTILSTIYLRAKGGLLVEGAPDKLAVLGGGDLALAPDPDAAGVPDDLADHVLCRPMAAGLQVLLHVRLPPADRPLGDVVRPDVRGHRGRCLAVPAETHPINIHVVEV